MIKVRTMRAGEAEALGHVMWDAIHAAPSRYTPAQRTAWLPAPPGGDGWQNKLAGQDVWVAEDGQAPVGFLTLAAAGYIDLAYTRAAAQGRGVFTALYRALEHQARAQSLPRLWTHASLMAQPAFAAVGFHVIAHETVTRSGEVLARAEMEKVLT